MNDVEVDAAPSRMSKMEFRKHLLTLDDHMASRDLKCMKFLCCDYVSISALENVHRGLDLFQELEKKNKLGPGSMTLLIEVLYRLGRHDLIKKLGYSAADFRNSGYRTLSPYRVLLFEICEEMCKTDLEQMKFMCAHNFSKTKNESLKDAEGFFIALEQAELLSADNLQFLQELLEAIDRADLAAKVKTFRSKSKSSNQKSKCYPSDPGVGPGVGYGYRPSNSAQILQEEPVSDRYSVPPINNMEEWSQRVQELYVHQQTQKKLQDMEDTEPSSPRSPQEHDTTNCYHVTDQMDHRNTRYSQYTTTHTHHSPGIQIGPNHSPGIQVGPNHSPGIQVGPNHSPGIQVGPNHSPGIQVGPNHSPGIQVGPNHSPGIQVGPNHSPSIQVGPNPNPGSLTGVPGSAGVGPREGPVINDRPSRGAPPGRRKQQPLTATVLTDAPRTQMSPSPQEPVQNTEAFRPSQPLGRHPLGVGAHPLGVAVHQEGVAVHPLVVATAHPYNAPGQEGTLSGGMSTNQSSLYDLPAYKMDSKPRGMCLILNNQKFVKIEDDNESKRLPDRTGSEYDCEKLERIFATLGFAVTIVSNLSREEMIGLMYDVARREDHRAYDCFLCCVLSHGALGSVYGSDGREVKIRELTDPFKTVICPGLRGKPKIFFIQACQGKQKQPGAPLHGDVEPDGPSSVTEFNAAETLPNEADFLIGYATVPGYVSFRSRTQGSWYITKLTEMLHKHAHRFDLLSILIQVNEEVSRGNAPMEDANYKQSPAPFATLRKKIYFR